MTASEIRKEIRYYENLISTYNKAIRKEQSEIEKLRVLKTKLKGLNEALSEEHTSKIKKVNSTLDIGTNIKAVKGYVASMNEYISGAEFKNTKNGLDIAQNSVTKKINMINQVIDDYRKKINNARNKITKLKTQLKVLESKSM